MHMHITKFEMRAALRSASVSQTLLRDCSGGKFKGKVLYECETGIEGIE